MAGTPEQLPERFVCMNCHVVAAGVPVDGDASEQRYEAPATCGACDGDEFARFDEYRLTYDEG